jgi:triosephosphate isomerase
MLKGYKLKTPFFEYGPKAYMWGEKLLRLARELDRLGQRYDVDILIDPQTVDIRPIAKNTSERVQVYAQHMDGIAVGKGMGENLAEALAEAGAKGVMLNHAERRLPLEEIKLCIARAEQAGLATMVCGDSFAELKAIAEMSPDIIVAEPSELIGTGKAVGKEYVDACIKLIHDVNPNILVLPSAGISSGRDCYNIVRAGASGSGSSSALAKAENPFAVAEDMIASVRKAWDELHDKN